MGLRFAIHASQSHPTHGFLDRSGLRRLLAGLLALFMGVGSSAAELQLTWSDNSDNEIGFEIERSLDGQAFAVLATVDADVANYTDASVLAGREYQYRVRAYNDFGYSGYTNVSVGSVPNTPPAIGSVEDVSVLRGEAVDAIALPIADAESAVAELSYELISSNLELLPLENLSLELSEGASMLSVQPQPLKSGSATITVLVSDGIDVAETSFAVSVLRNTAPTISSLGSVTVYDDSAVGPVSFTVGDGESSAEALSVSAVSLDESLVASESITLSGSGSQRGLSFATVAGADGTSSVRVEVSDGVNSTYATLSVRVNANAAPSLSGLEDVYTIEAGGQLEGISFTVSDADTASYSLTVSAQSGNGQILPQSGISVSGSGTTRSFSAQASDFHTGSAELTVSVSDGAKTTSKTVLVRVLAPEQVVKITNFTIEKAHAVIEVEDRPGAVFSLWKIHSRDGAWETVADVEITRAGGSVVLRDPNKVTGAVCYRVVASQ